MAGSMRKLVLFLSLIMLVSAWTGMAQAVEVGPCPEMSAAAHEPVYCDGNQEPADCDKDCPRHLSCHGHHVGTPMTSAIAAAPVALPRVFVAQRGETLAGRELEQALRPPKA